MKATTPCSRILTVAVVGLLMSACATIPTGPSMMVLPGSGKSFEQFQGDDVICRQWAARQVGVTPNGAATESVVTGAAIGTVLGAAAGAAIGAASGRPGTGAAVGAGIGLLGGTAVGAGNAQGAQGSVQRRYDTAYTQCMYAKGNQVPMAGGYRPAYTRQAPPPPSPPPPPPPAAMVPPPPPGVPPPPPPGPTQ
jgi:hypothetical protein